MSPQNYGIENINYLFPLTEEAPYTPVYNDPQLPVIISPEDTPDPITLIEGETETIEVEYSAVGGIAVQWQYSESDEFTDVQQGPATYLVGSATTSLEVGAGSGGELTIPLDTSTFIRCSLSNDDGQVFSPVWEFITESEPEPEPE